MERQLTTYPRKSKARPVEAFTPRITLQAGIARMSPEVGGYRRRVLGTVVRGVRDAATAAGVATPR